MGTLARALAAALLWGTGITAATLSRLPYLQNVSAGHATILWAASERSSGAVEYISDRGETRVATASVEEFTPAKTGLESTYYQYRADLQGLRPSTRYTYRLLGGGTDLLPGKSLSFRTAGAGAFRFLAIGDSGTGSPEQLGLASLMQGEPGVSFLLHTGDIAYQRGTYSEFQAFYFDVYAPLMERIPFFPTPGNHEYYTQNALPYLAAHVLPGTDSTDQNAGRYYSFDWGDAHFISVDTVLVASKSIDEVLDWLERDLGRTRQYWKIVYFHHAPYTTGHHKEDVVSALVRERMVPILENHGVQLVLSGHEHSYQRTLPLRAGEPVERGQGTVYIITAAGGASLQAIGDSPLRAFGAAVHHYLRVEVTAGRMTITAVGLDGKVIDYVVLQPAPRATPEGAVNAGNFTPALAPGSLLSLFGRNLAFQQEHASSCPLPRELSQTTLSLDGHPIPLLFVSPSQINSQIPYSASGRVRLRVTNPNGSSEIVVSLRESAPAILSVAGKPAITHLTGEFVSNAAPAFPQEALSVYLTGLGPVDGDVAAGEAAPAQPLMHATGVEQVRIGGQTAKLLFAGLTPGVAGLYQLNIVVPSTLEPGVYPLQVFSKGAQSNIVSLFVGASASPK